MPRRCRIIAGQRDGEDVQRDDSERDISEPGSVRHRIRGKGIIGENARAERHGLGKAEKIGKIFGGTRKNGCGFRIPEERRKNRCVDGQ